MKKTCVIVNYYEQFLTQKVWKVLPSTLFAETCHQKEKYIKRFLIQKVHTQAWFSFYLLTRLLGTSLITLSYYYPEIGLIITAWIDICSTKSVFYITLDYDVACYILPNCNRADFKELSKNAVDASFILLYFISTYGVLSVVREFMFFWANRPFRAPP